MTITLQHLPGVQSNLEEAIDRAYCGAETSWKMYAEHTLEQVCRTQRFFSADDLWQAMKGSGLRTEEPRALGAIIRNGAKRGWCIPMGNYVRSKRKPCHGRPIRIWQSIL